MTILNIRTTYRHETFMMTNLVTNQFFFFLLLSPRPLYLLYGCLKTSDSPVVFNWYELIGSSHPFYDGIFNTGKPTLKGLDSRQRKTVGI